MVEGVRVTEKIILYADDIPLYLDVVGKSLLVAINLVEFSWPPY